MWGLVSPSILFWRQGSVCLTSVTNVEYFTRGTFELLGESPLLLPHPNLIQEFWEWQVCATTAGFFTRIPGNKTQAIGSAWLTPLPPKPYPQTSEVVKKIDFWARNEARLVEHSPSKSEALDSVPSTIGTGDSGTHL